MYENMIACTSRKKYWKELLKSSILCLFYLGGIIAMKLALIGTSTMIYKKFFIIFIFLSALSFNFINAHAAESPENVGDFFRSLEQGNTANPNPAPLDAGESVQSLPGVEIKPEQMQEAFPTPLQQDSPHMDFIPNAAPLFPALDMHESGQQKASPRGQGTIQNGVQQQQNQPKGTAPYVPAPKAVPNMPLSKPSSEQASSPNNNNINITAPEQEHSPLINSTSQEQNIQDNTATSSLDNPSLEMMVGQMIMAGFSGGELEKEATILNLVRAGKVGGVFLVPTPKSSNANAPSQNQAPSAKQENIYSPNQLRVLTAVLQGSVPQGGLPLFIATEQEGGKVQSLRTDLGFSGLKAAASLGQGTVESTEIAARSAGLEMAGLGINFVLAPAGDINVNPLSEDIGKRFRSFGPNPQGVAGHVIAFGKGLAAAKVLPCLRNFPGTGSRMGGFAASPNVGNTKNILYDIPDIGASWQSRELIPYTKAIENGWQGAIQPALVYHRALDALHPASLSRTLVHGILRGRMGFDGIVLSQDMRSLQPQYSLEAGIVQSILAGVDIILISEPAHLHAAPQNALPFEELLNGSDDLTKQLLKQGLGKAMPGMGFDAMLTQKIQTGHADEATKVYDILLNAVRNGRIPMDNIRASWKRILKAKKTFLNVQKNN